MIGLALSAWKTLSGVISPRIQTDDVRIYANFTTDASIRKSATETITASSDTLDDTNYAVECDCTSNAITINLPTAVGNEGLEYIISKVDTTANNLTIDPNGSELINGDSTMIISFKDSAMQIYSNNVGWRIK
jgi:hypothetical protein